jgi:hypothetical protein
MSWPPPAAKWGGGGDTFHLVRCPFPMHRSTFLPLLFSSLILLAECLWGYNVHAQVDQFSRSVPPINYRTSGIRFRLVASIKADSASPYAKSLNDQAEASLAVKIRISSYALGSQFFGEVTRTFSDFSPIEGSTPQLFWQDAQCHQRRGFPKATVIAIDGSVTTDRGQVRIQAHSEVLGLMLPHDVITPGMRLPAGVDKNGRYIAFRSETKLTHFLVEVKTYEFACKLTASEQRQPFNLFPQ